MSEAWEPGARPAGRQQQPALLQPSLPKALTVHVSPLPGAGRPQAAVCLAPIHQPARLPRSRRRTAAGLPDFAAVRQGDFWGAAPCESRRRLKDGGGSQRPRVFKRATGCRPGFCNRPEKGGLRTKRRLAAPRYRSVLPCRVCSGAGRSVPAKHGSITFTDAPCRPSYALAGTATLEVLWK